MSVWFGSRRTTGGTASVRSASGTGAGVPPPPPPAGGWAGREPAPPHHSPATEDAFARGSVEMLGPLPGIEPATSGGGGGGGGGSGGGGGAHGGGGGGLGGGPTPRVRSAPGGPAADGAATAGQMYHYAAGVGGDTSEIGRAHV